MILYSYRELGGITVSRIYPSPIAIEDGKPNRSHFLYTYIRGVFSLTVERLFSEIQCIRTACVGKPIIWTLKSSFLERSCVPTL